jgi:hypothetical protein
MEFSVKRSDLLDELNLTQGVVERKSTIPILSNLLQPTWSSASARPAKPKSKKKALERSRPKNYSN